jgi:sterol desaturase/sphingolipid hydroxylase (fatty acid hydroxylase superfamily)
MNIELPLLQLSITLLWGLGLWILERVIPMLPFRGKFGHDGLNVRIGILNALLTLPFNLLTIYTLEYFSSYQFGLNNANLPFHIQTGAILIALDFWMYVWHRLNHQIPFLWHFHKAHHSDSEMCMTTAFRFHPIELLISEIIRLPILILLGVTGFELVLYNLLMMPVIQFHHSNIRLCEGADKITRLFFPSPLMHHVHHSKIKTQTDSNYGVVLSIWDRLFGSFHLVARHEMIELGLEKESEPTNLKAFFMTIFPKRSRAKR